jgi:hypothetical protein
MKVHESCRAFEIIVVMLSPGFDVFGVTGPPETLPGSASDVRYGAKALEVEASPMAAMQSVGTRGASAAFCAVAAGVGVCDETAGEVAGAAGVAAAAVLVREGLGSWLVQPAAVRATAAAATAMMIDGVARALFPPVSMESG